MKSTILLSLAILLLTSSILSLAQGVGYVEYTLVLDSNTLIPGNTNVTGGGNPLAIAFDPNNTFLYVLGKDSIFIVDPTNNSVLGKIPLPSGSTSIAYVPTNGYIYVATNGSGILVINTSTKEVVGKIPINGEIWQMIYANGHIYASVYSSNEVIAIDPSNNTIIATIKVGLNPVGIAYDPKDNYVFVANYGSNSVSIIDPKDNSLIANVTIGGFPWGIAYDPKNDYIYVTEYNGEVVVLDPTTEKVVEDLSIGNSIARCVAYDPINGLIYVTVDSYNAPNNVTVIDPTNNTIVGRIQVGYFPWGITYVPSNGYIYVANEGSGTLSVIATQATQSTLTQPTPTTFVPTQSSTVGQGTDIVVYIALAIVVVAIVFIVFFKRR